LVYFINQDGIKLTKEQIVVLNLSERDIKNGRLISNAQLDKSDLKWLKEL
jgi:HKD family nuclease